MVYGHDRTIHQTKEISVEVDKEGNVVSVWFRCMALPFHFKKVEDSRTNAMKRMYEENSLPNILAIEVEDK